MSTYTETTKISSFDIQPNGCIAIRKTIDVLKDGVVISTNYLRTMLVPNDPNASSILDETYYANLAQQAWTADVVTAYQAAQAAQAAAIQSQQGA
jgi:hypothetical protein